MPGDATHGDAEIRHLRSSINDLISLQTLPAIWDGRDSGSIVSTLLDVLVSMLQLDFAYVRLSHPINGSPVEFLQLAQRRAPPPQVLQIGGALDRWLTNESADTPLIVPNPAGDGEVKIAPFRLGLTDEIGVLVASSKRINFPTPTEMLLLRVAANQALVALQEARQLHEQRRAAEELERRVADRTAQLTAANEALRESEKKYRTLFESIDEGFCTVEVLFDENDHPIDYRFLEVNPSFEKQTGIQNARGRRMREIAPKHEQHWFEIYGRIALQGEPVRFENQAAQLHRWYDAYAFRVGEPGDRKVAVLFKDITEQRQSQEAMRAAKARFEGILAIAEDAIISVDSNQHIILFNQGGEKVFGYAGNEVMGKPLDILLPQRFAQPHRAHIEEFAKTPEVSRTMAQRREVFGRRKDGSEFPAEASISKLTLANEVLFTVILRDITERKRAEATLREQASLLNLTHDSIVVRNIDGVISFWNHGAVEMYGWTAVDAAGKVIQQLLQTVFPMPLDEINAELQRTGFWEGELVHTKADGTRVLVASRWSLQRDERQRPLAILETNDDITTRKRAEEALCQAQAELAHMTRITTMGELTTSIAHEVNQPLTAVVNNANACISLLPKTVPHLAEVREALAEIIDDANRASDVIARVRQLAKKAPIEKSFLDLRDVVREVLALARYESAARHVTICTDLSQELPSVSGDRVQLLQVLLNLVINGMDAMNKVEASKRVLTICGWRETHEGMFEARLSVEDSGVGFKPEEMDRLFEAFYTTKPQGMGMGLAISRSIIEAHGGRLWAEPNQGPGATFIFRLPAATNDQS